MTVFAAPAAGGGSDVRPADLEGHLLVVEPLEYVASIPTSMGVSLCTFCKIHWSIGRPGKASAVRDYSNLLKGNILTAVATYERYF